MTSEFIRCPECDGYNCDDGCAYPDTRATPSADPLAGLVRYEPSIPDEQQSHFGMIEHRYGEYVLYSEAAAKVDTFKGIYKSASRGNEKLRAKLKAAEAELAQIKAQEPVMWLCVHDDRGSDRAITTPSPSRRDILKADGYEITPLYASPIAPEGGRT